MKQANILIIDDDLEDQQLMKEAFDALVPSQRKIHFAGDGQVAFEFLSQYNDPMDLPCLIVLDLNIPKLTGVDILKMLKSHELLNSIPVIILSSSSSPMDMEMAKKEGAVEYFTKPTSFVGFKEIAERFSSYCAE